MAVKKTPVTKKRRVSHANCKRKGDSFENEVIAALDGMGLYSQKVLGSGKFNFGGTGAAGDIKVGIKLNEDGTKPPPDETPCVLRLEAKNHAVNPYYGDECPVDVVLAVGSKPIQEAVFKHLNQDKVCKAVVLRRPKIPAGALKDKKWDDVAMVCLGLESFGAIILELQQLREQVKKA